MASADGLPILHDIKGVIKARLQQRHVADLVNGDYKTTPYLLQCDLTVRQWKVAIMGGPRQLQREQIQFLTSSNKCAYMMMKYIRKTHPHATALYNARHTCLRCHMTSPVYPAHHVLLCPANRDRRNQLYTSIVGILQMDKVVQGKRPPIASLVRKLWINIDQGPTITPIHRQAMLLIVPPAYIRLNCGFPAASDGALERVNQAIQEYRRDVTQLDMSAYYTMMSKLTRHGTNAPSEPVSNGDEPVRAEGSPTFLHDTPPSKRQRTSSNQRRPARLRILSPPCCTQRQ